MADAPTSGSPEDWLRYVRSDLTLASVDPRPGLLLESLCYHSQQAVEKSLKAVLVSLHVRPPKTHDVRRLLDLVREMSVLAPPLSNEDAEMLTGYSILSRYPADLGEIDEAEWTASVEVARAVAMWAEGVIMGAQR